MRESALAPVVVFAVGNPSRGDDAIGPLLAERFADALQAAGRAADFELIEDFQLQVEHAIDLQGRALALFIDAGTGTPAPFTFAPVRPAVDRSHSTHALSPAAALHVYCRSLGGEPPPAYVLCVRGEAFELGEDLSVAAQAHLAAALAFLGELAADPRPQAWEARCRAAAGGGSPACAS